MKVTYICLLFALIVQAALAKPKKDCSSDSDCQGNQRCCESGVCAVKCRCEDLVCPGNEECVKHPEPHCECLAGVVDCAEREDLCESSRCDNHEDASCSVNDCGACRAVWFEGELEVVTDCRQI